MKLSLICLLLLCISPVLLFPTEGLSEESKVSSLVEQLTVTEETVAVEKIKSTDSDEHHDDDDDDEETSEPTTPKSAKNKHNKNHKRPNKRVRDRNNQLKNNGKRTSGFRRRPANEKKGEKKTKNKSVIEYEPRSSQTDKLNTAIDDMLLHFAQTLKNENSTFNWRLGRIPSKLKIEPWGFVVVEKKTPSNIDTKLRFERDVGDDDGLNSEEDEDEIQTTTEMAMETTSIPSDQDAKVEDDDDDDDENDDEPTEARTDNKETRFQLTLKPWPVTLSDGTVEYNLQLLGENDLKLEESNSTDVDEPRSTKKSKNRESRRRGYSPRRYPRRIYARTEGIENIVRSEDALIGYRGNSTTRFIDTKVKIGPIQFILDNSAYPLNNTRVTSPLLSARFRLMEKDGKLITAKLKRDKIRSSDVIVTLMADDEKNLPADADRLVNYFSNEMSKMWNSGHLLNRVKRQFKQLYVKTNEKYYNAEARKLTQKMLSLSNVPSEEGPSTIVPLVFE